MSDIATTSTPAPIVQPPCGPVRGFWRPTTDSQRPSAAFLGIPFAHAPIADLRFQAPRAHAPWSAIKEATSYGPTAQRRTMEEETTIPEPSIPGDSVLNVNVFTPAPGDVDALLPVMVWIHG